MQNYLINENIEDKESQSLQISDIEERHSEDAESMDTNRNEIWNAYVSLF